MKLTKEILDDIKNKFEQFCNEKELEIVIDDSEFDEDLIFVEFPRENDNISYNIDSFLKYLEHIESINFSESSTRTNNFSQFPIFSNEPLDSIFEKVKFVYENDNLTIKIVENPFLIGMASVEYGFYSKYFPPCSTYYAIEIEYKNIENKLSSIDEEKILKSFIFEYYQVTKVLIETTVLYDYEEYPFENRENQNIEEITINELIEYNDAMESYLKALDSQDMEIQFLYYYKIIEYFSPIISKLKAYELLSRKLDTMKYKNIENNDLNKIFEISDTFRKSKTDSELCKTVLSNSIDIIDLFTFLPDSVIKIICKNSAIDSKHISYEMPQEKVDSIFQQLGKILYSTRNKIVHAKSNYSSDGFECKKEDLEELNKFLLNATFQILKWNNKLPKHIKTNI